MAASPLLPPEVLKAWAAGKECVAPSGIGEANVADFVYEAVAACARGELAPGHLAGGIAKCGLVAREGVDLADACADALWLAGATAGAADAGDDGASDALVAAADVAKEFVAAGVCSERMLRERLELDHLDAAGLLPAGGAAGWRKKEVKVNTRLKYEQKRFNLLHEESEGWAKAASLLHCRRAAAEGPNADATEVERHTRALVTSVQMLVGRFDLDPNRVMDVALDALQAAPADAALRSLLKAPVLKVSALPHLLGAKFRAYAEGAHAEEGEEPDARTAATPPALYDAAAALVADGILDVGALYAHLSPSDAAAAAAHKLETKAALDAVRSKGMVNLSAASATAEEKALAEAKREKAERERRAEAVARREANQKLGLAAALLERGCAWDGARALLRRLAPIDPASHPRIRRALLSQCTQVIAPLYAEISVQAKLRRFRETGDADAPAPTTVGALPTLAFELLAELGSHLSTDVVLLAKVCRCLRAHIERASIGGEGALAAAQEAVCGALSSCVLPSCALTPSNPALLDEAWQVLQLLPWGTRYRTYAAWDDPALAERSPALAAVKLEADREAKWVLKRLVPENVKMYGRRFCKATHAFPLPALSAAVKQVETYPTHTENVVGLLNYMSSLDLDALAYVVVERLASARDKLKEDGQNIAGWLQSLASFAGHVWRRHSAIDMHGLLEYIIARLRSDECLDLVVLQELLARVCNVEWQEELSGPALDKLAGGRVLRSTAVVVTQGMQRGVNTVAKAIAHMRAALVTQADEDLAVPLLALIGHQRSAAVYAVDMPHLKLVSELVDRSHVCFLQYAEFLQLAVAGLPEYGALLPSLDEALPALKLGPDSIFHVYRPLLAAAALGAPSDDAEMVAIGGKQVKYADLLDTARGMLPSEAWQSLSPELYLTFWALKLSDVRDPAKSYADELKVTREALANVDKQAKTAPGMSAGLVDKAGVRSTDTEKKRDREKGRLGNIIEGLTREAKEATVRFHAVGCSLKAAKGRWFAGAVDPNGIDEALLTHCVLPRVTISQIDAIYAARFVETLVKIGTPGFSAFRYFNTLLAGVRPLVYTATEYEAGRMGRFLAETFAVIAGWVDDRKGFESTSKLPGFAKSMADPEAEGATYVEFAAAVTKWYNGAAKAFLDIFEAGEYMEMRNALIVLTKLQGVFPKYMTLYEHLERAVEKIKTSDPREDLKVLANRYHAVLQREQRDGSLLPFPDSKEALEPADSDEDMAEADEGEVPQAKATKGGAKAERKPSKPSGGGKQDRQGGKQADGAGREGNDRRDQPTRGGRTARDRDKGWRWQ
eukprot:PRCOL_00006124-RA